MTVNARRLSPVGVPWRSADHPTAINDGTELKPNTCVWNVGWNVLRAEKVENPSSAQVWQQVKKLVEEYEKNPTAGPIHSPDRVTKQQLDALAKIAKHMATQHQDGKPPGSVKPTHAPATQWTTATTRPQQ